MLATLFMPELVQESRRKADVALANEMIDQALKLEDVATADVQAADAGRGSKGDPGQVSSRSRPLGFRGQPAHGRGREDRGRPADPAGVTNQLKSNSAVATRPARRS